jgi:hypothetical protein
MIQTGDYTVLVEPDDCKVSFHGFKAACLGHTQPCGRLKVFEFGMSFNREVYG